ncbi:hypothetical protein BH11ACT4_BH11ACT4_13270 [soil metagenome]
MPDSTLDTIELVARQELWELVRRERFARDQRRWEVMADCFHPNAWVRTTWYDGIGGQAYVDATRAIMGDAPAAGAGGGSKHWVFPGHVKIEGDRATIESPAEIFGRRELGNVMTDMHTYCRFFSRAIRQDGRWKLLTFHLLLEWSELRPAIPGQVPEIDLEVLAKQRASYQWLGYSQAMRGVTVNPDLLGDDRWDELVAFHRREDEWLAGQGAIDEPE